MNIRISQEDKELVYSLARERKMSVADFIIALVHAFPKEAEIVTTCKIQSVIINKACQRLAPADRMPNKNIFQRGA